MRITRKNIHSIQRLLAAMLILAVIAVQADFSRAWATPASSLQVTIGNVSVTDGQMTRIPVSIGEPETGIGSYGIQIDFDHTMLEVGSVTPSYGNGDSTVCATSEEGCFASSFDNESGWIRAIWVDSSGGDRPIAAAKELFTIQVLGKSTTSMGGNRAMVVDPSDPSNLSFTDTDMNELAVQVIESQIQVSTPSVSTPSAPPVGPVQAPNGEVKIVVNGQEQSNSATLTTTTVNNKQVTTVSIDENKVIEQLKNQQLKTVLLPVSSNSEVVVAELNGKLVKSMENQAATLEVRTKEATYTLPAAEIQIDSLSSALGNVPQLQDIKVSLSVTKADAARTRQVEASAKNGGMSLAVSPIDFEVSARYGDKTVEVNRFNSYVERGIALPEGVDPSKITTGVIMGKDGSLKHVPTKVTEINGIYFAQINSLTNSTYAVIWNPKDFKDSSGHWAGKEIADLASRLVVQGNKAGMFEPERSITRAEFTALLLRALGLYESQPNAVIGFTDVAAGNWFSADVLAAASYGLVSGYVDGTFKPDATITRAEAMVMLERASALAKLKPATASEADKLLGEFSDERSVGPWARDAVATAIKLGITQGADGKLTPAKPISRAQTAVMVRRLLVTAGLMNTI